MPKFAVAKLDAISEGGSKLVSAGGKHIALFKQQGKVFALDATCPHAGGPLNEGFLGNGTVACPLHGWLFNLTTGSNEMGLEGVSAYPVTVENGEVKVEV